MNFTGSLDLAQARVLEHGNIDAPRCHPLADLLLAQYPQMRVLFMSGFQDYRFAPGTSPALKRLLAKPFSPDTLLAAVRAALDEPRKRGPSREGSGGGNVEASGS